MVAVTAQSHNLKKSSKILLVIKRFLEVYYVNEKGLDITERLQKIGQTVSEYKDSLVANFKDMEVEVKDWHFSVGKAEKEYVVEVNVKLGIKSKSKA